MHFPKIKGRKKNKYNTKEIDVKIFRLQEQNSSENRKKMTKIKIKKEQKNFLFSQMKMGT